MPTSCGSSVEGMGMMKTKNGRWTVGVCGDSTRTGRFPSGTDSRAVAVFGDSTLDMRHGLTAGDEVTVHALAGFGDVRVIVPVGSRVEISGLALFGNKRSEVTGDPGPDAPVVRIKAWALFGDVHVA